MCGINGAYIYTYRGQPVSRAELRATRDHMAARGPDAFGEWYSAEGDVGLGHRRLSIIDLSDAGAQPMMTRNGSLVITFNGEIYNYLELREQLEREGCVFTTRSDTEVILHMYATRGRRMLSKLRGMFAFAIWDEQKRGVLLARDSYGIKPLYYSNDGTTLRFASQVRALVAGGQVAKEPDPAGWAGFYLFGSVPEPYTAFRAIKALPAGSSLWVDESGVGEPLPFMRLQDIFGSQQALGEGSEADVQGMLREALLDSVRHHLLADVPVGLFLSSGIDSGALAGLMADAGQHEIRAVTLGFEEFRGRADDEVPLAERIAATYGARHTVRNISAREFNQDLPKILDAMDQPSIDGLNTWFVSKATRECGLKVALSGVGGDELFGGYPSFRDIPRWVNRLSPLKGARSLGGLVRSLAYSGASRLPAISVNPKALGMLEYGSDLAGAYMLRRCVFMPWELDAVADKEFAVTGLRQLQPQTLVARTLDHAANADFASVSLLESSLYMRNQLLRDTDWSSMAHSIEVRTPLVDVELLRRAGARLSRPSHIAGKGYLASSPSRPLPETVTSRAKTGFTTPIEAWMEINPDVSSWRSVPSLRRRGCPWARRWAYVVAQRYQSEFGMA